LETHIKLQVTNVKGTPIHTWDDDDKDDDKDDDDNNNR